MSGKPVRPDFQLTQRNTDKIVNLLDFDYDTFQPKGPPSEVCQALGIDRRIFNSIVTKAIFAKKSSAVQQVLRRQIMDIIYNQTYVKGETQ